MKNDLETTWETYTSSWKTNDEAAKREIFAKCLDEACVYSDPVASTEGWDALMGYMAAFQEQVPGGHFETFYFQAHNNQSVAKWHMKIGDAIIGEGVSFGRYNGKGKLSSMTGFFETP